MTSAINQATDALLLIDLQLDFMPGGALAVGGGDEVVPLINSLASRFDHVLLTQDWHPLNHISFASTHARSPFEEGYRSPTVHKPFGPIIVSSTPKVRLCIPRSMYRTPN